MGHTGEHGTDAIGSGGAGGPAGTGARGGTRYGADGDTDGTGGNAGDDARGGARGGTRDGPLSGRRGCWVNLFEPTVGELVGRTGYDYALLDMEHSPVTLDRLVPMVRAVQLGGARALVRAPDADPAWIGRLMDLGADGAMVPRVESAAEAERLARAAEYAPRGTRGMAAPIVRGSGWGTDPDYLARCRERFVLMVQVETRGAVEAAGDIARVDGVDAVFIGPYDLSGSLGNTAAPDHATTRAAIERVIDAVRESGKPLSTLPTPEVDAAALFAQGFDLVFSGSDVSMLREAMRRDAATAIP